METAIRGDRNDRFYVKVFSNMGATPTEACDLTNDQVEAFLAEDRNGYIGELRVRETTVLPIQYRNTQFFMATINLVVHEWGSSQE